MKITINQLRKIIKEEISKINKKSLMAEGHTRITAEEIMAWRNGDWGFVSEGQDEEVDEEEDVNDDD